MNKRREEYRKRLRKDFWRGLAIPSGYITYNDAFKNFWELFAFEKWPYLSFFTSLVLDTRLEEILQHRVTSFSRVLSINKAIDSIKYYAERRLIIDLENRKKRGEEVTLENTVLGIVRDKRYSLEASECLYQELLQERKWDVFIGNREGGNHHLYAFIIIQMIKKELQEKMCSGELTSKLITEKGELYTIPSSAWVCRNIFYQIDSLDAAEITVVKDTGYEVIIGALIIEEESLKVLYNKISAQLKPKEGEESSLRPNQFHKQLCQAVAKTLWDINPEMTIQEMQSHHAIQEYGEGKRYKGRNTLRGWLSEVDPREKKRGRKPQKEEIPV